MQNGGCAALQRLGDDPVAPHGKAETVDAVCRVDLPDAGVAGLLERKAGARAEKLGDEGVEIFRARPHQNALRRDGETPASRNVGGDSLPQLRDAGAGASLQDAPVVFTEHPPHGLGEHRKGKVLRHGERARRLTRGGEGSLPPRRAAKAGVAAAALARLHIALVREQGKGVLHRHKAHAELPGQKPLGGQLRPPRNDAGEDIVPELGIELHIGALAEAMVNGVFHLVL